MAAAIKKPRRYYLRKSQELIARGGDDEALGLAFRAKQDGEPGTPLPADFPFRTTLAKARYTTREDLDGADERELMRFTPLTIRDARAVLKALAALLHV